MYNNHRVVACTPFGREETIAILFRYLRREHENGLLDTWQLWMNTDANQESDRAYGYSLARDYAWVETKENPRSNIEHPKQRNTKNFFEYCVDPEAVYVRFDDDIVYLHEDALRNIVESKLSLGDGTLCVFPIIWNNAISSWHLQQRGKIPFEYGVVGSAYCMDPIGWANTQFAERIHNLLLRKIEENDVPSLFLYQDIPLERGQQYSVSCFATEGRDYCKINPPGRIEGCDDEYWHTIKRPAETGQVNMIMGAALVSHYSFYPQRHYLRTYTDILARYGRLAAQIW